jgi:hypothetical protein
VGRARSAEHDSVHRVDKPPVWAGTYTACSKRGLQHKRGVKMHGHQVNAAPVGAIEHKREGYWTPG